MATESRLAPVPGPVPHSYTGSGEVQLPEAFTSTATHFTPIILTSEVDSEESIQHLGTAVEGLSNRADTHILAFTIAKYLQILYSVCDRLSCLLEMPYPLAVTYFSLALY